MIPIDRLLELAKDCLVKLDSKQKRSCNLTNSDIKVLQLCRLWAGMGHIYQVSVPGHNAEFVIKHVTPPPTSSQSFGDRRKATSYQVEARFYEQLAASLRKEHGMVLPSPYLVRHGPGQEEITICMSLLRGSSICAGGTEDAQGALTLLAKLHTSHWGSQAIDEAVSHVGLQETGSYWYLDTRPDEHSSMSRRGWEGRLKRAARAIDECLKRDAMQCLIHGDPKDANIMRLDHCPHQVAMYDFQYCGKGTPSRDLAYFLCSSCNENDEEELVDFYFAQLSKFLSNKDLDPPTREHFQASLELAFCDYCRFMCGWGHWGYDLIVRVQRVLHMLDGGKDLGSEDEYDKIIRKHFW